MGSRSGGTWRMAVIAGCAASMVALAGCSSSPSAPEARGASTPPATQAATAAASTAATSPAPATGIGTDYCAFVIKVNNDAGTMVNKTFVPTDKWTRAQLTTLIDFTLGHRVDFLGITPPELKSSVEAELRWMEAIKAAGYDLNAAAPAGTADAMGKITNYQIAQCGISYG